MEKISKDQLLKYINVMIERTFYDTSMNPYERFAFPVFKMKEHIENGILDLIDIQERTGHWYSNDERPDTIICSECGSTFDVWKHDSLSFNYCPNCGTKMDGDTDG